jgi:demethylmenaquinone methyltransferase / 2-methoxy-6-polyprenyl-1,4-benzoquinol methylase
VADVLFFMQDPAFVQSAFAKIAGRYVVTNHALSFGTDILWRRKVARLVRDLGPETVLDLATGSGDLAAEILKVSPRIRLTGADFCAPMLDRARAREMPGVTLLVADAMRLPFADGTFDCVTVAFGLRNMASWPEALRSMLRVLRPGGHLVILDFSLPSLPVIRPLYGFYLNRVLPLIAGLLTGERGAYQYLAGSIHQFPSGKAMWELMETCGFVEPVARPLSFGIATVYTAKRPDGCGT